MAAKPPPLRDDKVLGCSRRLPSAHHLPPLRQGALQTERVSSPSYRQVGFLETEPIFLPS